MVMVWPTVGVSVPVLSVQAGTGDDAGCHWTVAEAGALDPAALLAVIV